jgi:hypothetical protein
MKGQYLWGVIFFGIAAIILFPLAWIVAEGFWPEWFAIGHPNKTAGTEWQMPGAWGFHTFDIINALLLFVTLAYVVRSVSVAEAALNKSHHAYVQSLVDSRYDAMDRLYFDLLRERRERSYTPAPSPDGAAHALENVDPYPLMVWNFIETIVDKCEKDPSGELMRTWAPLISAEAINFGDWMLESGEDGKPRHSAYFKNDFVLLANALVPASRHALSQGDDLDGAVFLRLYRALEKIKHVHETDEKKLSRTDSDYVWLKGRLRAARFPGFADDAAYIAVFDDIHRAPALRAAAAFGWDFPKDIRQDDIQNNEEKRKRFVLKKYRALIETVLAHLAKSANKPAA